VHLREVRSNNPDTASPHIPMCGGMAAGTEEVCPRNNTATVS